MIFSKNSTWAWLLCFTIAIYSCNSLPENELDPISETLVEDGKIEILPQDLLKFLEENKLSKDNILKLENGYLIDNDILVSKEDLKTNGDNKSKKGSSIGPENYHAFGGAVSSSPFNYRTIKIKFDSSIPTTSSYLNWRSATAEAISEYNKIRNLRLKFEIVYSGSADITISGQNPPEGGLASSTMAATKLPSSGDPFPVIYINPNYEDRNSITESQKKFAIAHEFGHSIGFVHTNDPSSGTNVIGTGDFDFFSVMNGGTAGYNWTAFSYLDLLAFRTEYPFDTGELPLYVYRNINSGGFNWTRNWYTYQYGANGYEYHGLNGYVFTYQVPGSVPLYKYKNSTTQVTYMTLNGNLSSSFPSYVSEGLLGYVFTSSAPDRNAVYEWYHPNKGYHFTTLTNDAIVQSGGWTGGGIAFYTMTLEWN